jgi:hypothetical protein
MKNKDNKEENEETTSIRIPISLHLELNDFVKARGLKQQYFTAAAIRAALDKAKSQS